MKKRSSGIVLFGIVYIFLGILVVCTALYPVILWITGSPELDSYAGSEISFSQASIIYIVLAADGILLLVSSMMLLKLNIWGYRLSLPALIIPILLMGVWAILILLLAFAHILFFNRSGIKEQFNQII